MDTIKVYEYARCGTCKKALKWLDAQGLAYEKIAIVDAPPTTTQLKEAMEKGGGPRKKLVNTSGQSYRQGGFKERLPEMSEQEALEALAADGKLIKRPLLIRGDIALVGFKETDYQEKLG